MRERGRGTRFLLEPVQTIGIRRERGRQDLDRDVAMEARVAGSYTSPIPPAPMAPVIS